MKNHLLIIWLLAFAVISAYAQDKDLEYETDRELIETKFESPLPGTLNTFDTISRFVSPAEVLSVAIESEYMYTLASAGEDDTTEIYLRSYDSLTILDPLLYYEKEKGLGMMLYDSPVARKIFEKGENAFMNGEWVEARRSYLKTLELDPSAYICSLYIAQTYKHVGNQKEYEDILERYLEEHPGDALAIRFKGLDLYEKEEYEESLEYMIHSTILNRNNPLNALSLDKALSGMDKRYDNSWEFVPRFQVDSVKPKEIFFTAETYWSGVAMMDMIYEFDPAAKRRAHYRGDLGKERQIVIFMSLVSLSENYDFEDSDDKALVVLSDVIDNETQMGYFLYEVLLPRYPYYGLTLSDREKEAISEYLVEYRFIELGDEDE